MASKTRLIVHLTDEEIWNEAKRIGEYRPDSLTAQGFIHCSTPDQYVLVANYIYKGRKNLVLLSIDSSKVKPEIRYKSVGDRFYPHIYGPLNLDAVVKVPQKFRPRVDGTFNPLPEESLST